MNKKLLLSLVLLVACSLVASAQDMKFNPSGKFKIVHLTDLHFVSTRPEESAKTFARMDWIVEQEHPDFIAITGDVIFGKPAKAMLQSILDRLDSYKVPFAIVYGNHDAEQEMSRPEMSQMIASAKYSVNTLNDKGELADIRVPVAPSSGSALPLDIYMMDSNDYCRIPGVGGYAWFSLDQILWLRDECERAKAANGGVPVPSMSFFHIPVPEFFYAWVEKESESHNSVKGIRGEFGGHPKINSGMFASMLETGSMMAVCCGHDHNSDYIIPYYGISLVYARYSGDGTVYNNLPHGVRVYEVTEGERGFRTWIREDRGRVVGSCHVLDGEFVDD